jgi:glycosyltransferase involved in cell wall biosynthesis
MFTLSTSDRALLDEPSIVFEYQPRPPIRYGLYLNDLRRRRDLSDLERVHKRAAEAIDALRFDVVLADVCRYTSAPFALKYLRTPAAYYCHEPPRALHETAWRPYLTRYQQLRRFWRAPIERSLQHGLREIDRELVRSARLVLTNSEFTRRRIERIYGVDARVCPPGIAVPPGGTNKSPSSRYVLSVGTLEPHKGFAFLIEAIATVPEDTRPALHVVGNAQNDGYRVHIERLAKARAVDLTIKLAIPEDGLAAEYRGATLFVFAAHDEPLGLAPLEAMAHGLPVLAVNEGGPGETVRPGENGVLVPRDAAAFGVALTELLEAPTRRAEMSAYARAYVENEWSWSRRGPVLEECLESIREATPAPGS